MNIDHDIDIDKLKRKKHLNVQEQIFLRWNQLKSEPEYWRQHGLPKWLDELLTQKGIRTEKVMVFQYDEDDDYQQNYHDFGNYESYYTDSITVLTEEESFFYFEVELNKDRTLLIKLNVWEDVTEKYEISEHKKGIGMTDGFLALEILKDLNSRTDVY